MIPWLFQRGRSRIQQLLKRANSRLSTRAGQLAYVIDRLQPDIVHTLEMQHAGYLMSDARRLLKRPISHAWVYSCWGNDINFFQNQPDHRDRIERVLQECDYYTADCERDMTLMKRFARIGEALPVFPTGGGYRIDEIQQQRVAGSASSRRVIALKGYHDEKWTGRALTALEAIHKCADALQSYEIVIYRAPDAVRYAAEYVARVTGLRIAVLPYWVRNDEILRTMGRSRIALAVSISDGTPNAMLEAMIMGAFPIQTNTADTNGWLIDGETGLLVPSHDVDAISRAIRRAVADDKLVDRAAERNALLVRQRLDYTTIRDQVIEMYRRVAAGRATRRTSQDSGIAALAQVRT